MNRCKIYTLLFLAISFEWSSDTLPLSYQQDLPQTFPGHPWLDTLEGHAALRRVLVVYSLCDSNVGYCQEHVTSMGELYYKIHEYVLLQSFKGLRLGIRTGSMMYHLLHAHTDLCFMKYQEKTADADHPSLQVL
ncbi:hypothetical protein HN51_048919 [Arachis hypogaea]